MQTSHMDLSRIYGRTREKTSPSLIEWTIIISVCLMPFTALKTMGSVGPSEILLVIAFGMLLWKNKFNFSAKSYLSKLFLAFFLVAAVGTIYNSILEVTNGVSISEDFVSSTLFDMFSYMFAFIGLWVVEMHEEAYEKRIDIRTILVYVIWIELVLMGGLYLLSRSRDSLWGMSLTYFQYFTPLAANLHHTSMFIMPLGFATIYVGETQKNLLLRIAYYGIAGFFLFVGTSTGSEKAIIGTVLGLAICAAYFISTRHGQLNKWAKILFLSLMIIAAGIVALNAEKLAIAAASFFMENDMGNGREGIWLGAIKKWKESPFIGFGYGPHSIYEGMLRDAHNSFLTAALQGGLIGGIIYFYMWVKHLKYCFQNGFVLAINASILVYAFGGDVLRRIPCWFFMIASYYLIKEQEEEKDHLAGENYGLQ